MTWIRVGGDAPLRLGRAFVLSLLVHATAVLLLGFWLGGVLGGSRLGGPTGTTYEVSLATFRDGAKGEEGGGGKPAPGGAGSGPGPVASGEAKAGVAPLLVPADAAGDAEEEAGASRETNAAGDGLANSPGSGEGGGPGGGQGGSPGRAGGTGGTVASGYQPPRLLAGALPIDPKDVQSLLVPPEISVRIRVGTDGRALEIVPEMSTLSPAVLEAIRRSAESMRFSPARLGGEPVEAWFPMTFVHRR